jgi:acyl-CoA thioester hydrolase
MAEWIETFKGVIHASEYDPNAHMNTQAYASRFDQATWFLLAAIGLTPRTVREHGLRIAVLRQSFQFLRELRGSELVMIESGFVAVGRKHLRFQHRMIDVETRQLIAAGDCTAVPAALETSRSVTLGAEVAERAKALLVTANDAERTGLDARL